jgi:phenylacetate-CoA ligase
MDELTVRVETRPDAAGETDRKREAVELEASIKQRIGVTVRVDVVEPGGVERSAGKAARIVDRRAKG